MNSKLLYLAKIFLIVFYFSPTIANSQAEQPCPPNDYVLAYINGVRTTPLDAAMSVLRLQEVYGNTYNNRPLKIARFYNPTDGAEGDIAESYKQAIKESPELETTWENLHEFFGGRNNLFDIFSSIFVGDIKNPLRQLTESFAAAISKADPGPTDALFLNKANEYLDQKKKVVFVSHSQGNFYADSIYQGIKSRISAPNKETVKFVHVASPTKNVHGATITNSLDLLIETLRPKIPNLPGPNVTVDPTGPAIAGVLPDPVGHNFLATYMNQGYAAFPKVKAAIDAALLSVSDYPCDPVGGISTPICKFTGLRIVGRDVYPVTENCVSPQFSFIVSSSAKLEDGRTLSSESTGSEYPHVGLHGDRSNQITTITITATSGSALVNGQRMIFPFTASVTVTYNTYPPNNCIDFC